MTFSNVHETCLYNKPFILMWIIQISDHSQFTMSMFPFHLFSVGGGKILIMILQMSLGYGEMRIKEPRLFFFNTVVKIVNSLKQRI